MAWSDYPGIRQLKYRWFQLRQSIAQDVPDRIAKCEFDCERTDCAPDAIRECQARSDYALAEQGEKETGADGAESTPPDATSAGRN